MRAFVTFGVYLLMAAGAVILNVRQGDRRTDMMRYVCPKCGFVVETVPNDRKAGPWQQFPCPGRQR